MASRRQPIESAGVCDSTTSGFEFPSESVPSNPSFQQSRLPTEHTDSTTCEKSEGRPSDIEGFSTVNPEIIPSNQLPSNAEKKPDMTFLASLSEQGSLPPPAYSDVDADLGTNNVMGYRAAVPQQMSMPPQQITAMDELSSVSHLPVKILGERTKYELSLRLDPEMLPSLNWKIMAECMGFNNWEIRAFENQTLKAKAVIEAWSCNGHHSIGELLDIINRQVNRPDVITDIPTFILQDAERHQTSIRRSVNNSDPALYRYMTSLDSQRSIGFQMPGSFMQSVPAPSFQTQYSYPFVTSPISITQEKYEERPSVPNTSKPVQVMEVDQSAEEKYDAFVLCSMADTKFVLEKFLPKVETDGNLKLCIPGRDMYPGQLQSTSMRDYMLSKSRKLVVILSDEFFESHEHVWQSNLAISHDPASRQQKIIPVKYKKIQNKNIFDYLGCCDLTKSMKEEWFWDKIIKGIKA